MSEQLSVVLTDLLRSALKKIAPDIVDAPITLERPKEASHGDYATSVALQLARRLKRNPREIAQAIVEALGTADDIERIEVAGAGFINFHLRTATKLRVIQRVLEQGASYGRIALGAGQRMQVEFVSANPTGPLHVGHGRGAAYGASLANVLEAAGYDITREYYVNDAGRQMDILAVSTWLRYLELAGESLPFPRNAYQGDYVREMATKLRAADGERYLSAAQLVEEQSRQRLIASGTRSDEGEALSDDERALDALITTAKGLLETNYARLHQFVLTEQLEDCRQDLEEFGVRFDRWYSEQSLYDSGRVGQVAEALERAGHAYLKDGALWFRSTTFGDEKDRVIRRENGIFTYFASDIAYHVEKFERGFDRVIDVWGADHHGYVARVKGALQALGVDSGRLHVALVQFAVLYRGTEKVSMSTRAAQFVTLRELRREVGNDAARFFYVLRKSDQHLDFDLDLAKAQSLDNPVYYLQYAHARISSVLAVWGGDSADLAQADLALLTHDQESALASRIAEFPQALAAAARDLAPHHIAFYLRELCAAFHSYYNAVPFLVDDQELKHARLALVAAIRQTLANGLRLLGVSAPERM